MLLRYRYLLQNRIHRQYLRYMSTLRYKTIATGNRCICCPCRKYARPSRRLYAFRSRHKSKRAFLHLWQCRSRRWLHSIRHKCVRPLRRFHAFRLHHKSKCVFPRPLHHRWRLCSRSTHHRRACAAFGCRYPCLAFRFCRTPQRRTQAQATGTKHTTAFSFFYLLK